MPSREYTPRQVAQMLRVSTRTVLRWFDAGRLPGYRCLGSRRRRIPHAGLLDLMRQHNLPLTGLEGHAEAGKDRA
jgi:excisionase family DNA binding protein